MDMWIVWLFALVAMLISVGAFRSRREDDEHPEKRR